MRLILMAALLVGCGTDEPAAPTCATAVPAYYEAGCTVDNATRTQAIDLCQEAWNYEGQRCPVEFDALVACFDDAAVSGCDCAAEFAAVDGC